MLLFVSSSCKFKTMLYKVNLKQIEDIFNRIREEYTTISPVIDNGVIYYRTNHEFKNLPTGSKQVEFAGGYQLYTGSKNFFSYVRPANTIRHFLMPSPLKLYTVKKTDRGIQFEYDLKPQKLAIFDIRRCDLKALKILDMVYLEHEHPDVYYLSNRQNLFLVGVDCLEASSVCFCGSMMDCEDNYGADMFITELEDGFLVDVLTERASKLIEGLNLTPASEIDLENRKKAREKFKNSIHKSLDINNLKETLYKNIEHPYWQEIGKRCLSCTNCTQVCPTCFCFDIKEVNSLDLSQSERYVFWDSCFNQTFATVHKFNVRDSVASRYRQWLMHKMAYWQDQFGDVGCVGCGRCITWCPAKIDIQVETSKLREL